MTTKRWMWMAPSCLAAVAGIVGPLQATAYQAGKVAAVPASQGELFGWKGAAPDADECMEAIARARVLVQVDGAYAVALAQLDKLWWKATAVQGFDRQEEVLIDVALARAEIYRKQGKLKQALQAATELLIRPVDFNFYATMSTGESEPASEALLLRALKASNDPRLAKIREELKEATTAAVHTSLDEIVREAYLREDYQLIGQAGAPAQEAFAKWIVADADSFPANITVDPLMYLVNMNPQQAARILLAELNSGGPLWKRRIVRAIDQLQILTGNRIWTQQTPYLCLEPEWLELLEALLSSKETALQCTPLLSEPFLRNQLSRGIQSAIVRGVENFGSGFVNGVLQAIDYKGVVTSVRPVLHAIAGLDDTQARRFAARGLAQFESDDVLRSMLRDQDAEVRHWALSSLLRHRGTTVYRELREDTTGNRVNFFYHDYTPALGDEERAAIAELAGDPSAKVRQRIAEGLELLQPPLEDEVYLRLAGDPDQTVRALIARASTIDGDLRNRILTKLAADESKEVIEQVDDVLEHAPLSLDPTPYQGALQLRWADTRYPLEVRRETLVAQLTATPIGFQCLGSIMTGMTGPRGREAQDLLFRWLHGTKGLATLSEVDDQFLATLFNSAYNYAGSTDEKFFWDLYEAIKVMQPPRRGAMRSALSNTTFRPEVRLFAAVVAAGDGDEVFVADLITLLRDDYWNVNQPRSSVVEVIDDIFSPLTAADRQAAALRIVQDSNIPSVFAEAAAEYCGSYDRDLTLAILERWPPTQGEGLYPVKAALNRLAAFPEDADSEHLKTAVRNPYYTDAAVRTILAIHRKELLPTLDECIEAPWITNVVDRMRVSAVVVDGLSRDLSDEASAILFKHMQSASTPIRNQCVASLANIEETRARQERWSSFREQAPSKESALAELVAMTFADNQAVRVQAIRGIGCYGAIEYMPMMIRLLEDPDPEIAQAAIRGLELLNVAAQRKQN